MAETDKALVTTVKNLTTNQALALQLKFVQAKNEVNPYAIAQTKFTTVDKLPYTVEQQFIEAGKKGK